MYYALNYYPPLDTRLATAIDAIRQQHDPTVDFIKPHITVLFPVPEIVGESCLTEHLLDVLGEWKPLEVCLGGLSRSPDHWLFLTLSEGAEQVKQLYRSLYTGICEPYRRDDIEMEPHLALGLFIAEGSNYDCNNPQAVEFDQARYAEALEQAKALPLENRFVVKRLHLVAVPAEVLEWATGQRTTFPREASLVDVREFELVDN